MGMLTRAWGLATTYWALVLAWCWASWRRLTLEGQRGEGFINTVVTIAVLVVMAITVLALLNQPLTALVNRIVQRLGGLG